MSRHECEHIHYRQPNGVACGRYVNDPEHITEHASCVTCGNCLWSKAYKAATHQQDPADAPWNTPLGFLTTMNRSRQ